MTTLFIGAHYEIANPGSGQTVTKYYFAGAQRIAMRKSVVPQSSTLTYLLGDHLGSTSLAVDASTGEVGTHPLWANIGQKLLTKHPRAYTIQSVDPPRLREEARFMRRVKMTEENELPETYQTQVTNLSHVDVGTVKSEMVRMAQSSATDIEADDIELTQSAVLDAQAVNLTTRQSALALVQANEISMQQSTAGAIQADSISINNGAAGLVVAGRVEFGNAYAGIVVGREIRGEKIESMILLSRKVEGNVTTIMDTRGALIAGLVGGLFAGMMLLLGRMVFRRK